MAPLQILPMVVLVVPAGLQLLVVLVRMLAGTATLVPVVVLVGKQELEAVVPEVVLVVVVEVYTNQMPARQPVVLVVKAVMVGPAAVTLKYMQEHLQIMEPFMLMVLQVRPPTPVERLHIVNTLIK
jgi:hypothetical protein